MFQVLIPVVYQPGFFCRALRIDYVIHVQYAIGHVQWVSIKKPTIKPGFNEYGSHSEAKSRLKAGVPAYNSLQNKKALR
jgi:hypothetical protein